MINNDIGYHEDPKNGNGITRAKTTKQIRSWEMLRSLKSLNALNKELGGIEFPGLYVLVEKNKVYIGEAKNLINRLDTHTNSPEDKIKDWDRAVLVNDGRPATQSDFNDAVIRKSLELYLIKLFKANKYVVVSQGEPQRLNSIQQYSVSSLKEELRFLLLKKNIISKDIEKIGEEEIFLDELREILTRSGKTIQKWKAKESIIDNKKVPKFPNS